MCSIADQLWAWCRRCSWLRDSERTCWLLAAVCIVTTPQWRCCASRRVHKTTLSAALCISRASCRIRSRFTHRRQRVAALPSHSHSNALPWNRISAAAAAAATSIYGRAEQSTAGDCSTRSCVCLRVCLAQGQTLSSWLDCRLVTPSDAMSGTIFSASRGWSIRVVEHSTMHRRRRASDNVANCLHFCRLYFTRSACNLSNYYNYEHCNVAERWTKNKKRQIHGVWRMAK